MSPLGILVIFTTSAFTLGLFMYEIRFLAFDNDDILDIYEENRGKELG